MEEQTLLHGARAEGEAKSKLDIARKLLLRGYTAEEIADLTELTITQVQDLAKEQS
jgi:predicted transposase YdaD